MAGLVEFGEAWFRRAGLPYDPEQVKIVRTEFHPDREIRELVLPTSLRTYHQLATLGPVLPNTFPAAFNERITADLDEMAKISGEKPRPDMPNAELHQLVAEALRPITLFDGFQGSINSIYFQRNPFDPTKEELYVAQRVTAHGLGLLDQPHRKEMPPESWMI